MSELVSLLELAPLAGASVEPFTGTVGYVATGDVVDDRVTPGDTVEYETRPSRANVRMANGDVAFARMAATDKAFIVDGERASLVYSTGFACLRPDPNRANSRYIKHFLRSPYFHIQKDRLAHGATQKAITNEGVAQVMIPAPSLAEQRRIADILDKADAIRRKRKQAIALTEDLLRSAFLDMFGDPGTNPKGWEVRELNDFIAPDRPITYGILKPGPDIVDGVPYVRVVDIRDGVVKTKGVRRTTPLIDHEYRRSRLRAGDLLMSIRGHVGRLAVVPPELQGANITQDTARIAPVGLDAAYLMHLLQTPSIQFWMASHVRGVAVQGINIGDVRRIPVPVPPPERQADFAAVSRQVLRVRASALPALASCELLFGSLVQGAFAGQVEREAAC